MFYLRITEDHLAVDYVSNQHLQDRTAVYSTHDTHFLEYEHYDALLVGYGNNNTMYTEKHTVLVSDAVE